MPKDNSPEFEDTEGDGLALDELDAVDRMMIMDAYNEALDNDD